MKNYESFKNFKNICRKIFSYGELEKIQFILNKFFNNACIGGKWHKNQGEGHKT